MLKVLYLLILLLNLTYLALYLSLLYTRRILTIFLTSYLYSLLILISSSSILTYPSNRSAVAFLSLSAFSIGYTFIIASKSSLNILLLFLRIVKGLTIY